MYKTITFIALSKFTLKLREPFFKEVSHTKKEAENFQSFPPQLLTLSRFLPHDFNTPKVF